MDVECEGAVWAAGQQREHNLASFQGQTVVRRRGTKRVSSKSFEEWQVALAIKVLERKDTP